MTKLQQSMMENFNTKRQMKNIDKAVKALNMAGMDAGFLNKSYKCQLAISVKGMDFALHEDEIEKWAAAYDEKLATSPLEAAKLIRRSCQALDPANPFDDKIRADLQAAMDLLNLYSTHNQEGEGDFLENKTDNK